MYQTHFDMIEGLHILRNLTKECFNISIFPLLLLSLFHEVQIIEGSHGQNICLLIAHIGIYNIWGYEARESRQLILITQTLLTIMATLAHNGHFGDGSHIGYGVSEGLQ